VAYRVVEAVGRTQAFGTEGIRKERIKECAVRAVFIDYAKAFDHVDHSIVIHKLLDLGVQDT